MRISLFENFLAEQLNAKVSIENVSIGWNSIYLQNLQIKSDDVYSFQGNVSIKANFANYFKQPVHLQQINIEDSVMSIVLFNGSGSEHNWSRLLFNLPAKSKNKLIVDKLVIDNLKFDVKRHNGKIISIPPISHMEFENLGKMTPLTAFQIIRLVFQTVLSKLQDKPFLSSILERISPLPPNFLKGTNAPDLYKEETKSVLTESLDTIKRKTQEAKAYLEELFSN